jgi:hypothetical protein
MRVAMIVKQRGVVRGSHRRWIACLMGGLILLGSAGCGPNEDITRTTEPRIEYAKPQPAEKETIPTAKIAIRLLAAIAPAADGGSWFFKLMGPAEMVAKQEAAFDAFLSSIQFTGQADRPVTWVLPEGWREGPKKNTRYATILTSPSDDAVELAVSTAKGSLLDNVNRWRRDQLGLDELKADELGTVCGEVTTKQGKKLTRVDLSGTAPWRSAMPPVANAKIPTRLLAVIAPGADGQSWFFKLMGPAEPVGKQESAFDAFVSSIRFTDQQDKPVTWVMPEGWREGPKKPIRYATILPCSEDDTIELSVTLFGGGLLENVNRWRVQQLGLEPVKQDQLDTVCREVQTIQGKKVTRVDLSGMAPKGPAMPPFMKGR